MTAREAWNIYYRYIRVTRRENAKAHRDLMKLGTGIVFYPNNGDDPKRIPVDKFRFP